MGNRRLHRFAKAAGVAVTLVMVALGGTAFACTTFVGRVTVKGDASTATSVSVGYNKFLSDGMYYCPNQTRDTQGGAVANYKGTATITVAPTTACTGTGHAQSNNGFPGGTYDVNFVHRRGGTAPFKCISNVCTLNTIADCMSPRLSEVVPIGSMSIDSAGYSLTTTGSRGSRAYPLPATPNADTAGVQSAVCVSDTTATYANEIPIRVL
jgi:hypothetical protein